MLLESMGPHRILALELHTGQIQGFFNNTPVDHLFPTLSFVRQVEYDYEHVDKDNIAVVAPDAKGVEKAKNWADTFGCETVVYLIQRKKQGDDDLGHGITESVELIGEVDGKVCIMIEDMVDTAISITKGASKLKEEGALSVIACATHGVFSPGALDNINLSCLEKLYVTDTILQTENLKKCSKLAVVSVAPLIANAIQRLHEEEPLGVLFKDIYD